MWVLWRNLCTKEWFENACKNCIIKHQKNISYNCKSCDKSFIKKVSFRNTHKISPWKRFSNVNLVQKRLILKLHVNQNLSSVRLVPKVLKQNENSWALHVMWFLWKEFRYNSKITLQVCSKINDRNGFGCKSSFRKHTTRVHMKILGNLCVTYVIKHLE